MNGMGLGSLGVAGYLGNIDNGQSASLIRREMDAGPDAMIKNAGKRKNAREEAKKRLKKNKKKEKEYVTDRPNQDVGVMEFSPPVNANRKSRKSDASARE